MPVKDLFAAIDVGSHSLRMCLAEMSRKGYHKLESLAIPVELGRDTFSDGKISHKVLADVVEYLRNFDAKMNEYGATNYRAVATSALREARNADVALDRMLKLASLEVEVIEGSEEARLIDQRVGKLVEGRLGYDKGTSMLLAFGAGSCQIAVRKDGHVLFSETHPLGTVRLLEMTGRGGKALTKVIGSFVERVAESLRRLHELAVTDSIFVINEGLPRLLTKAYGLKKQKSVVSVPRKRLEKYVEEARGKHEKLALRRKLRFDDAEKLSLSLLLVDAFLELTKGRTVYFPEVSLVDAILYDELLRIQGRRGDTAWLDTAESAAVALGEKYNADKRHHMHVRKLAMRLFDQLGDFCGLDEDDRPILNLAALLHDIGAFVNPRGHHKHSAYLIAQSEIMGLDKRMVSLVSQVARYHRRSFPKPQHQDFHRLDKSDQLIVRKLASILRIADALDRDHVQRVSHVRVEHGENDFTLICALREGTDMGVSGWAMKKKADMFEELFGVRVFCKVAEGSLYDPDSDAWRDEDDE